MNARSKRVAVVTVVIWLASAVAFGLGLGILSLSVPPLWVWAWLASLLVASLPFSALLYVGVQRLQSMPLAARWRRLAPLLVAIVLIQSAYDHWVYGFMPGVFGAKWIAAPFAQGMAFNAVLYVWLFSLYALVLELILASDRAAASARQASESLEAARMAQLEALRSQLSPHMLFNTFNNLSTLVLQGRNAEAETMLTRLSEFMRACFDGSDMALIPVVEELDLIECFIDVEAARFAEPLAFTIDCPADLAAAQVPRLILQPLIENAMKYAVHPSRGRAGVAVRVSRRGAMLSLVVQDEGSNGAAREGVVGTGRGLSIVGRRLETLYGDEAALTAGARDGGFRVELTLPLQMGPGAAAPLETAVA